MMLDAEAWAKNKGLNMYGMIPRCFHLTSLDHTVDFYKKCGYVVDVDVDDDDVNLYDDDGLLKDELLKLLTYIFINEF